jgi:hypothetical protein
LGYLRGMTPLFVRDLLLLSPFPKRPVGLFERHDPLFLGDLLLLSWFPERPFGLFERHDPPVCEGSPLALSIF